MAAPFAVEPVPAHEDAAGQVDFDVEARGKGRRTAGSGWRRPLAGPAVDLGDLEHDDTGRQACWKIDFALIDAEPCRDLRRGRRAADRDRSARRGQGLVA